IYNQPDHGTGGVLTIEGSTISHNYTERGAGLNNVGGRVSIFNSTISDNVARANGGGIRNTSTDTSKGTIAISQTTITENWAHTSSSFCARDPKTGACRVDANGKTIFET